MKLHRCLFAFALFLTPACSDSDDGSSNNGTPSGGTGGTGGTGTSGTGGSGAAGGGGGEGGCPLVALTCPDGCNDLDALILDTERACITRNVRVGCWPPDETTTADMACVKSTTSGALHQLTSGTYAAALAATDDYDACTDTETTIATDAPQCVNTGGDAGACPLDRDTCPAGCNAFTGRVYDSAAGCLELDAQLGCYEDGATLTKNGGCVEEVATGDVWLVTSGSYAQKMLISGLFIACGLDDVAGTSGSPPDCP